MYVIVREKGTRRSHSTIDLEEHAVFALFPCLFSETQARTNSQVHLSPPGPELGAIFSLQKRLLSFLLSPCPIEPALLEFFSVSSGNDAECPAQRAGSISVRTSTVRDLFWEPVWCFQHKGTTGQKTDLPVRAQGDDEYSKGVGLGRALLWKAGVKFWYLQWREMRFSDCTPHRALPGCRALSSSLVCRLWGLGERVSNGAVLWGQS